MFGFGAPKLPDDPVKMALLTTGLSMLASGDPQQTMRALPQVMGAALQAREQRKYRKAQMDFEKQKFDLQKQAADLKMQEYRRQQAMRENLMRMLGLGGSQQPAAPNLAQPAPGAISGPAAPSGAPAPQAPQVAPQMPAQTPPVAVGSMGGAAGQQAGRQVEEFRRQNPDVFSRVIGAIKQAPPEVRSMYANNPDLLFKTLNKATMKAAGLASSGAGKPQFVTLKTPDGKYATIDVATPEGYKRAQQLTQAGAYAITPKEASPDKSGNVLREQYAKSFSKFADEVGKQRETVSTLETMAQMVASDPSAYTGAGASAVHQLKRAVKAATGIDVGGTTREEVYSKLANQLVFNRIGSLGQGVSDADRKFMNEMMPGLTTGKDALFKMLAVNKLMYDAARERKDFIENYVDSGKGDILKAEIEWNKMNKDRRYITPERIAEVEKAYKEQFKFQKPQSAVQNVMSSVKDVEGKIESGAGKWNDKMEAAYSDLASRYNIRRDEFEKWVSEGKIRIGR
jgi:hypothetical protein